MKFYNLSNTTYFILALRFGMSILVLFKTYNETEQQQWIVN